MRIVRFLLALTLTAVLLWLLTHSFRVGGSSLPPLGHFFNPFSGFWQNGEAADGAGPDRAELELPGLEGPVQVLYDDLMVPHIFAQNLTDAYRAQGYVTAAHRLWQMDLMTRKAAGRLSEILGERTLNVDRLNRRRGMAFAAENSVRSWEKNPEMVRMLEAYTAGINAYIEQLDAGDYPLEFKLLNYAPEPWTPLKTALMVENMAENLSARETDLAATNTLALLGRETFDYLFPEWNPRQQAVVPDSGQWKGIVPALPAPDTARMPLLSGQGLSFDAPQAPLSDPFRDGSNNWALAGARTASGHPLLANDPHLTLSLPAIWYQVQLHTPDMNAYGVSLPGIPGIIIGFNRDIAWGVTNVSHDVSDWYRLQWSDPERSAYLLDGQARPVELRVETIAVRGAPDLVDTVRYTVWGPVVYDHEPEHPLRDCALRWLSHDASDPQALSTFTRLDRGRNLQDYRQALPFYDGPAQNFVFASREGDIAIQPQGRYPLRRPQQGRFVQEGNAMANAWPGFIPQEHVPFMINPGRGFVFSANQHSTPPSYPYYYLGEFEDFRSRRIHDRLTGMQKADVSSMKALQLDNFSQRAADALPVMLRLLDRERLDGQGASMADEMAAWPYTYDRDAMAATYFDVWFDSLYINTWDEMLVLREQKKDVLLPDSWRMISLLETDTNNVFFDDRRTPGQVENARAMVQRAFLGMQEFFRQNPQKRVVWGEFQPVHIRHLALIEAFGRLNLKVGGHRTAPNAVNPTHGPSWRMIVEPGEKVTALGVFPGGQSGNPGSPFYDNMVDTWANGGYYELLFLQSPEERPEKIRRKLIFKYGD